MDMTGNAAARSRAASSSTTSGRAVLVGGVTDERAVRYDVREARSRVLVVDDNADAAATLRMLLEVQGHDARAVYTGPAALDMLAQFDAEVVLLRLTANWLVSVLRSPCRGTPLASKRRASTSQSTQSARNGAIH